MLLNSKYPQDIINRVASNVGHLSNYQCAAFIKELNNKKTKSVVLAHISEENNSYEKINETFNSVIKKKGPKIHISTQENGSNLFHI
jgi:phosphoribosyl 1,2-cyclic phosphodiesterase